MLLLVIVSSVDGAGRAFTEEGKEFAISFFQRINPRVVSIYYGLWYRNGTLTFDTIIVERVSPNCEDWNCSRTFYPLHISPLDNTP